MQRLSRLSPEKLIYTLIVFFAAALLLAFGIVFVRTWLNPDLKYPLDQVFYWSGNQFGDVYEGGRIPDFHPMNWGMPPATLVLFYWFNRGIEFLGGPATIILFSGFWILLLWKSLWPFMPVKNPKLLSAILLMVSYPVLFCLDRGHYTGLVVALIFFAYQDIAHGKGLWAKYCIAIAASLKITPIGFILLFIQKKQYREAALTVILTAAITLVSASLIQNFVKPDYTFTMFAEGMKLYVYLTSFCPQIDFDSTIWALVRNSLVLANASSKELLYELAPPLQFAFVLLGFYLLIGAIRKTWRMEILASLICLYLLIASLVMQEYSLMLLLLPLLFLATSKSKAGLICFVLLALTMIPKPIFFGETNIRASTLINPILMTAAFAILILSRREKSSV